jgi:hypothetical protein
MSTSTRVRELFVIERGAPRLADLDHEAAVEQMLANTDDAYGFPPFRYLAPAITVGGQDYQQLRRREREILSSFLGHVRTRTLASDNFGWADEIPNLIGAPTQLAESSLAAVASSRESRGDAWPHWEEPLVYGRAV